MNESPSEHSADTRASIVRTGCLLLLSVALLSAASEPFGLWILAWFALVPWLLAVGEAPTMRAALARGWLAGVGYFAATLWWLWTASIPGAIVLVVYLALYWALAAGLIYGLRLIPTSDTSSVRSNSRSFSLRVLTIAIVWVAAEWLRCNVASGFPWLPLGCTQSPLISMCQVADFGGPWVVSWWVVLVNALLVIAWMERHSLRNVVVPAAMVGAILAGIVMYGMWRLHTAVTSDGPRVMVIQTSVRHLPGGAPSIGHDESVAQLLRLIESSLSGRSDLVVLPEAALPPINDEARRALAKAPIASFLESTRAQLLKIASERQAALLVGGSAVTGWTTNGKSHVGSEIRNSVYLFDPRPNVPVDRYDKVYLARFSERAPLTFGPSWLRSLAMSISATRASQPLFAGSLADLKPFGLRWRASGDVDSNATGSSSGGAATGERESSFITPICLENIDPGVVARMMRDTETGKKRADFIANVSNDGWFHTQEKYQHLQTTVFRCIENRVPMVRSSNTGISGFIDSCGRVSNTVPPGVSGFAEQTIRLDGRTTFYTRYGDVFPLACVAIVAILAVQRFSARVLTRVFALTSHG